MAILFLGLKTQFIEPCSNTKSEAIMECFPKASFHERVLPKEHRAGERGALAEG